MSHACHRFWKCYKTLTFCSLLTRCTIPCACHAKRRFNVQELRENVVLCTFWLRNVRRATTGALFRYLNFQKCSKPVSFLHFWLGNVLRATTACTFSTSQLPKVAPSLTWPAGSAPPALASLLFDPPEPQIIGKNTVCRGFPTFSRTWIFFLQGLSLFDLLSSSLLSSDSSHLCFSSVHIVGSLTFKLPSINVLRRSFGCQLRCLGS